VNLLKIICLLQLFILYPLSAGIAAKPVKKVLVFVIQVDNASAKASENLTEKFFFEMSTQEGIAPAYLPNEMANTRLGTESASAIRRGLNCSSAECAIGLLKKLGYDFGIVGSIKRRGSGFKMAVDVIDSKKQSVVFSKEKSFRQGKLEIIKLLPIWGRGFAKKIAEPNFPEKPGKPEKKKMEPKEKAWQTAGLDPYTSHLKGTRISGVLSDTLKQSKSPYIVTRNIMIPAGTELIIEKGVTIYMGGEYSTITVMGKILARGSAQEPIRIISGKKEQAPWDWDRIFFRSRERSLLEYVIIKNSNYGIVVHNGAVTLSHCLLEKNSVRGVYAENSNVEIKDSKIIKGHLIGIQVGEYGEVIVERSEISGNHNGISVMNFGTLMLLQSKIQKNDRGLILVDSVSVSLEKSRISDNRIGAAVTLSASKGRFTGLQDNRSNLEIILKEKVASLAQCCVSLSVSVCLSQCVCLV